MTKIDKNRQNGFSVTTLLLAIAIVLVAAGLTYFGLSILDNNHKGSNKQETSKSQSPAQPKDTVTVDGKSYTTTELAEIRASNANITEAANQLRIDVTAWYGILGEYPSTADVTSGLVRSDVPEAKLPTSVTAKLQVTGLAPTKDKPLSYSLCKSFGARVTYWQYPDNNTFDIGDVSKC